METYHTKPAFFHPVVTKANQQVPEKIWNLIRSSRTRISYYLHTDLCTTRKVIMIMMTQCALLPCMKIDIGIIIINGDFPH